MDKCLWDPVQVITWLGIVWDGVQGVVSITEPRLKKCLVHIDKVLSDPNVSARDLASPVGKIISTSAVLRNLSSIMTKHCQMSVAAAQDWDTPSPLDRYCIVQLEFCKDSLRRLNSRDLFSCNPPFISVYSDASYVACGGHILGIDVCAHRMFKNAERTQSFFPLWPFDHINLGYPAVFRATDFYRTIVPVIFCRVAVLFTLFLRRVLLLLAGWQCHLPS